MAQIIDFRTRRVIAPGGGTGRGEPSDFDTLECMYCGQPTDPSEVTVDGTVIYRCKCRRIFRITEDGSVHRGMLGHAF